jgi:hypothetical protein
MRTETWKLSTLDPVEGIEASIDRRNYHLDAWKNCLIENRSKLAHVTNFGLELVKLSPETDTDLKTKLLN